MMVGQELGDQYSIITPLEEMININNVKLRGYGFDPTKCKSIRSLDINVDNLREKIEIDPKNPRYLKVVWGVGYKIEK